MCCAIILLLGNPVLALKEEARSAGGAKNGRVGSPVEADSTVHQERRESNAKATTSATAGPAGVRPSQQKPAAQDRKRKQPSDKASTGQQQRIEDGAAGDVRPADKHIPMAGQSAAGLAHKLTKAGSASIAHDSTEAAPSAGGTSKPGVRQLGNQAAASAPFALPGSASTPSASSRPLSQTTSIPGGMSGSTRISLPPKLTQLASLRSKPTAQELKADSSPVDSDTEIEEAAAAAAAAVEAHLKGVTQQFDAMLHNTLQRTKESVHKVTQFAVRAAAGKHGKTAAHRLVIMILDLIETAQMSKRVDLFYLLDSLLQVRILADEAVQNGICVLSICALSASVSGHSMRIFTSKIASLVHTQTLYVRAWYVSALCSVLRAGRLLLPVM